MFVSDGHMCVSHEKICVTGVHLFVIDEQWLHRKPLFQGAVSHYLRT